MDGDNFIKGGGSFIGIGLFCSMLYFILGSQTTLLIIIGAVLVVLGMIAVILGVWVNNN